MEIKACDYMMNSTDPHHIIRIVNKLNGIYWISDYNKKVTKYGRFLNSMKLNGIGTIIKYAEDGFTLTRGNFIDDVPDVLLLNKPIKNLNSTYTIIESQNPYFIYNTGIVHTDGTFTNKTEYYGHGIEKKYKYTKNGIQETVNKDIFVQLFLLSRRDVGGVIQTVRDVNDLPLTLHDMYENHKSFSTLQKLLDNIEC
jgi:hypothetical protein